MELLRRTDILPIILEASDEIGGISRTIRYKGNRMDIGGHRFFSKSDRVMQWWMDLMPPSLDETDPDTEVTYHGQRRAIRVPARLEQVPVLRGVGPRAVIETETDEDTLGHPDTHSSAHTETIVTVAQPGTQPDPDLVMLIRPRKSRIYYLRKFFDYPIRLTGTTLKNLGIARTVRVGVSYGLSRFRQIKPERSLEDFLINRFGRELYLTFFKSYTEKVWGTPCDQISAEWGAQRIKGLSLTTAVKHFVRKTFTRRRGAGDVAQKATDTSLIERFMYPRLGPGQLWEHAAAQIIELGGEIHRNHSVTTVECSGKRVMAVTTVERRGRARKLRRRLFLLHHAHARSHSRAGRAHPGERA